MQPDVHRLVLGDAEVLFSLEDDQSRRWFARYRDDELHEPAVTTLLVDAFKRSTCFVDVGAFLGYYTCIACSVMTAGRVHSFEVDRKNFTLLDQNVKLNSCKNATIVNRGVGSVEGRSEYVSGPDEYGAGHRLMPSVQKGSSFQSKLRALASRAMGKRRSAEVVSLDHYFGTCQEKPDLVKIDVEGAEMEVLRRCTKWSGAAERKYGRLSRTRGLLRQGPWLLAPDK